MSIKGKCWKYGDNIDTDVIIPGRYCHLSEPDDIAPHALEDLDAEFSKNVESGDILVVGVNFGCGSSRELAPLAIKAAGISCVVAKGFARIFYRNAISPRVCFQSKVWLSLLFLCFWRLLSNLRRGK